MEEARVWITRTQPGADRLARGLARHGHLPWVAPVLNIERVSGNLPESPADDVVFVSEQAVRNAGDLSFCQRARVFAVGERTAAALARRGIEPIVPGRHTSEGLLALDALRDPAGRSVVLVSGAGGRRLIVEELVRRGARVSRFVCYRRLAVEQLEVDPAAIDAIVVSSGDGFTAMAPLWFAARGATTVPVLAPSARVANMGADLAFEQVVECAGADTRAILAGLERIQAVCR